MAETWTIAPLGDSALMVTFGDTLDDQTYGHVMRMLARLDERPPQGVVDLVPAYSSLTIVYDPLQTSLSKLTGDIERAWNQDGNVDLQRIETIEIPVCYDPPYALDLSAVAELCGRTEEEVIRLHTSCLYQVYMIGFLPGFPYLGPLPTALHVPRRAVPRTVVPAGSVGLAGAQTGIYPSDSPGGWQIIGRTPIDLFHPQETPPTALQPGQTVRFVRISAEQYRAQCPVKRRER